MTITFVVLGLAIIVFIWDRLPPGVVALGVALTLYLTGVLTFEQSIAGFGDPVIVFIAGLFVVSEALNASGITAWVGQWLVSLAGDKLRQVLVGAMLLTAALTALISVNGSVAALIPVGVLLALRINERPSKLLMPLAFAAHGGSLLTLLGSPVNLLISEIAADAGARPIGFFEFALVGAPLLVGTICLVVWLGPVVLPDRVPTHSAKDFSQHAELLADEYELNEGTGGPDGLAEMMIPPRSEFIGDPVFPGMTTEKGDLVVAAVHRAGIPQGSTRLRAGDVVVLRGPWRALQRKADADGLVPVDHPSEVRRQQARPGRKAVGAMVVLVLMVLAMATAIVPAAIAVLISAGILVATRIITVAEAHRSISITTLVIVAGLIPLSTAIQTSGAADVIADGLIALVGGSSRHLLLLSLVLVVAILGQFISNMATVLIVAPIATTIAETTGVSPLPLLMGICVAGAAAFLTPVATPANTMVLGPGAYKFGDYAKLGLPLLALFITVATLLVPVIWPF